MYVMALVAEEARKSLGGLEYTQKNFEKYVDALRLHLRAFTFIAFVNTSEANLLFL